MNGESYGIDDEAIPSELFAKIKDDYSMQEVKTDLAQLHRKLDAAFAEVTGKLDTILIWRESSDNSSRLNEAFRGVGWRKPPSDARSKGAMSGTYSPKSLPLPAASSLSSQVIDPEPPDNGEHANLAHTNDSAESAAASSYAAYNGSAQVMLHLDSLAPSPVVSGGSIKNVHAESSNGVSSLPTTSNSQTDQPRRAKLFQSVFAKDGTALKKRAYLPSDRHSGRGLIVNTSSSESSVARTKWHQIIDFLEEPESSSAAFVYSKIMFVMIMASCFLNFLQTVKPPLLNSDVFVPLEMLLDAFFLSEVSVRFMATFNKVGFFSSIHNCIDCISSGPPLILRAITQYTALGDSDAAEEMRYVVLCISPVFRMLKMLRRWDKFHLLMYSGLTLVSEVMPVLMVMLFMMAFSFASLIYFVEPDIDAMPKALWFTIITMSTVGYGDTVPKSTSGMAITLVLVISSALYMAVPLGIAGNAFSKVWDDRDWLQLVQHVRDRLTLNGYHASDIPALFKTFGNDSGEISLDDFTRMISEMGLGMREDRILSLFFAFDSDNSGNIDSMEFLRAIFPGEFVRMYGRKTAVLIARSTTRIAMTSTGSTRTNLSKATAHTRSSADSLDCRGSSHSGHTSLHDTNSLYGSRRHQGSSRMLSGIAETTESGKSYTDLMNLA